MAYVRRTDILIDAIKTNVRTMSAAAQEPYANDTLKIGTPVYDAIRQAVVDKTWEAAPNTQGTLPDEWCGTPRRVDVHLNNSDGNRMKSFVVEANEVDPIVLSPQYANESYPDVYINYADLSGASRDWADALASDHAKRSDIRDQFLVVESQLGTFMRNHASLNAALTEMPELEMYVPAKYMTKVHMKSEPRTKAERPTNVQDLNIDVNALAAAAITHRMVTASGAS